MTSCSSWTLFKAEPRHYRCVFETVPMIPTTSFLLRGGCVGSMAVDIFTDTLGHDACQVLEVNFSCSVVPGTLKCPKMQNFDRADYDGLIASALEMFIQCHHFNLGSLVIYVDDDHACTTKMFQMGRARSEAQARRRRQRSTHNKRRREINGNLTVLPQVLLNVIEGYSEPRFFHIRNHKLLDLLRGCE